MSAISFTRDYASKAILEAVRSNWASKWWLKPEYIDGRYDREAVEKAFDVVLQVFDDEWLEWLMSRYAEGKAQDHFYLRQFLSEGLYPLAILFSLGQDLLSLKSLEGYDQLRKGLRSDARWMSTAFEAEFAAHCVRQGLRVQLYPTIPNSDRRPDLLVTYGTRQVYIELKEIGPSDERMRYLQALNQIFIQLKDIVPHNSHLELIPNRVPEGNEVELISKKVRQLLMAHQSFPVTFKIGNLRVRVVKEKRAEGKSFSLSDLPEFRSRELKRLEDTLKKESQQLPTPYLGMLVIDATNSLGGIHEDDIRYVALRAFVKYPRSNIIGAFVVRSYKFYRPEMEPEAIYVENQHCKEPDLNAILSEFIAFSRTRQLV